MYIYTYKCMYVECIYVCTYVLFRYLLYNTNFLKFLFKLRNQINTFRIEDIFLLFVDKWKLYFVLQSALLKQTDIYRSSHCNIQICTYVHTYVSSSASQYKNSRSHIDLYKRSQLRILFFPALSIQHQCIHVHFRNTIQVKTKLHASLHLTKRQIR